MLMILRFLGFVPMLMLAFGMLEASHTIWRTGLAYGLVDPALFAEYRLYTADTKTFVEEIEAAIRDRDYAYATSLYALGVSYGHNLPPDLKDRAEGTWLQRSYASGTRAADGFVFGSVDSGAAIAGSLVSDLIGVGDVRDFSVQGFNYVAGREYDPVLLGFATFGLGLTAATYGSGGAAAAPDAGLSLIKNAYRGGKLSKPLSGYFARSASAVVDTGLLRTELKAVAGQGLSGLGSIQKAAARSIDRKAAQALVDDVSVLDSMRRTGGVRASVTALSLADGPADLRILQRISLHLGDGSFAAMKMLGRSIFRVGYAMVEILQAVSAIAGMLLLAIFRPVSRRVLVGFGAWIGLGPNASALLRPVWRLW
ncbi:hypothetical protein [Rhizobium sp. RU36D]|uniref:hypothetical protein n=1 Tax=Rhizobium sp. RU36D TaxID=1907415 RepID=UPI0009D83FEC|nr:hypothetical protein [Rhizobium sp. RU36D]SMD08370.1 hypothetical protein SAMN05880593_1208 [Rhizobium sp. RU36D]